MKTRIVKTPVVDNETSDLFFSSLDEAKKHMQDLIEKTPKIPKRCQIVGA